MTTSRRIALGALAQWFSRVAAIVLGLLLLPVLLGNMPKEEVGIWLLLGQSWALLGILDLGFGTVLARRMAQAKGKSGGSPDIALSPESVEEITCLITAGKIVYRWMSAIAFVVAWLLGFTLLQHLEFQTVSTTTVWLAWTVMCVSQAITVWSSTWTCLLFGMGNVGWDAIISTIVNSLTLLTQIALVFIGHGILSLAITAAAGALIQRILLLNLTRKCNPILFERTARWNPNVLRGIPVPALQAWLSTIGSSLIFATDSMFIASNTNASDIPAYRAAFIILLNIHVLASAFSQSSATFVSQLWQAGAITQVQEIVRRNLRIGLLISAAGAGVVFFTGESLFNLWLGPGNYIGPAVIGTFIALFIFEQQSIIVYSSCRAIEYEKFSWFMLAGGLLKIALALPLMKQFGLLGLALSSLISQFLTTYWFIAAFGLAKIHLPFPQYCRSVILPCFPLITCIAVLCFGVTKLSAGSPDWLTVAAACLSSSVVLAIGLWFLCLTKHQRRRCLTWLKIKPASTSC